MSTMSPVPPAPQHQPNRPAADKKSAPEKKATSDASNSSSTDASGAAGNAAALDFLAFLSLADSAMPLDDSTTAVVADDGGQFLGSDPSTNSGLNQDQSAWAAMALAPHAGELNPHAAAPAMNASSTVSLGKDNGADMLGASGAKAGLGKTKKTNEALLTSTVAVAAMADAQQRKDDLLALPDRKQEFVMPPPEMAPVQVSQTVLTETAVLHKPQAHDNELAKKQDAASPVADAAMVNSASAQGGIMGVDGVVATGAVLELDRYQKEDVVFWGAGDVQNADVTVTGLDGDPLGITVSMQGNEAQVAFRTDVPEVRSALEASNHQLRESLNAHGMALAGMSVGQFGQSGAGGTGGDGADQGRPKVPEGARKAQVAAISPHVGLSTRNPSARTGSGLDLYV